MKKLLLALLVLSVFACKENPPAEQEEPVEGLLIESLTTERSEGECDTPDGPCAHIFLTYPMVKNGSEKLIANVSQWANDFLIAMLDPGLEPDAETTLSSAIEGFLEMHRETVLEMPELPSQYEVEVTDTVLLLDSLHLTLRLDAYSYTGGAHPNAFAAIATFDVQSGKQLIVADLVDDVEELETLAEQYFREERKADFEDGFDFDESWPFKIADNVGLTTDGLFFCYIPYEVGPYAMGFTEFVIPYEALKSL